MTTTRRIATNTLAMYSQTVLVMALTLFSGRWVLQALGPVDYGLMGVVGALIAFIALINRVAANAVSRFFALSIGRGDLQETTRWFNTALSVHTILPTFLILVGWPIGEWMIGHFLSIPPERISTAHWVFRLSLISAFCGMSSTPYLGMFTAKQNMKETAVWGILSCLVSFLFVYWLTGYRGDAWLAYSIGTVCILILFTTCQVLRARRIYPECRIDLSMWYDKRDLRQLTSFAGWSMLEYLAGILRTSGTAILLNKFFPPMEFPAVNASYSVGNNVAMQSQTLSSAMYTALAPEIVSTTGRGDHQKALDYSHRASKFSVSLILVFAIPLVLEIDFVLLKWLQTPPPMAATFCCLLLVMLLADKITLGQLVAINARGKIAGVQITVGFLLLLSLPMAWIFLSLGYEATSVVWSFILTAGLCSMGRVVWAKRLVNMTVRPWLHQVLLPCCKMILVGSIAGGLVQKSIGPASWQRLVAVCGSTLVAWSLSLWLLVFSAEERIWFMNTLRAHRQRFLHAR